MTPKKGGRRTKDEEISFYLESLGIDREELEETGRMLARDRARAEDPDRPKTYKEMAAEALQGLRDDYENLSGVAKVQAYKAIQSLAKEEGDGGPDGAEVEPSLVEILDGIRTLSPARKQEILTRELAKLDAEREQILGVLNV